MRITISSLEECVVCVYESQTQVSNGGLRFLNLKEVCQKMKPNGFKIVKNRSQTCISKISKIFKLSELKPGFSSIKKE
jgi:hypothetical protein